MKRRHTFILYYSSCREGWYFNLTSYCSRACIWMLSHHIQNFVFHYYRSVKLRTICIWTCTTKESCLAQLSVQAHKCFIIGQLPVGKLFSIQSSRLFTITIFNSVDEVNISLSWLVKGNIFRYVSTVIYTCILGSVDFMFVTICICVLLLPHITISCSSSRNLQL